MFAINKYTSGVLFGIFKNKGKVLVILYLEKFPFSFHTTSYVTFNRQRVIGLKPIWNFLYNYTIREKLNKNIFNLATI